MRYLTPELYAKINAAQDDEARVFTNNGMRREQLPAHLQQIMDMLAAENAAVLQHALPARRGNRQH